jgi:hypothetical protein
LKCCPFAHQCRSGRSEPGHRCRRSGGAQQALRPSVCRHPDRGDHSPLLGPAALGAKPRLRPLVCQWRFSPASRLDPPAPGPTRAGCCLWCRSSRAARSSPSATCPCSSAPCPPTSRSTSWRLNQRQTSVCHRPVSG